MLVFAFHNNRSGLQLLQVGFRLFPAAERRYIPCRYKRSFANEKNVSQFISTFPGNVCLEQMKPGGKKLSSA
jgi:hypothetical protein